MLRRFFFEVKAKLKKIFEPIQIGTMTLKNRLVVPAMASNYSNEEGMATEQLIGYHEAKAKGGWGLIIVEDYRICPEAGASAKLPGLYNPTRPCGWRKNCGTNLSCGLGK